MKKLHSLREVISTISFILVIAGFAVLIAGFVFDKPEFGYIAAILTLGGATINMLINNLWVFSKKVR